MVVISSTFSAPNDGVLFQESDIQLLVNDVELGTGSLYITENNVVWGGGMLVTGAPAPTLALQYRTISLHAIQREPTAALYMVLNYQLRLAELNNAEEGDGDFYSADDEFDAEETPITQLRFLPSHDSSLAPMYAAMTHGQSLHPDPQEDDGDDEEPYDAGDTDGDDQFEDAEEDDQPEEEERMRRLRLGGANGCHDDIYDDADVGEE